MDGIFLGEQRGLCAACFIFPLTVGWDYMYIFSNIYLETSIVNITVLIYFINDLFQIKFCLLKEREREKKKGGGVNKCLILEA